ncbi:MAG TPA: nucleotidyltransferase family protein [Gammaproteobacteria bacterium]|nr:nucleotidyltransferase family protein [Gammaproteobacteria bacterium]
MTRLACIVLAAGGSRRLGRPKQLVRWRARPLLVHAVEAAAAACASAPIVVLGADAMRLRGVLRRAKAASVVVENRAWPEGLAASLRAGLDAVPLRADAVLVVLADQPHVGAAALRRLVAAWRRRPGRPAASAYAGRLGVPAILPRTTWRALRALEGDVGARRVLASAPRITAVAMPEAELDVDLPEDLTRLSRGRPSRS